MNCYPNDTSSLSVANYLDSKPFFVSLDDNGKNEYISVYIDEGFSTVTYRRGITYGSFEVKNSAFSLGNKIVFDEFSTDSENPIDEDAFATECVAKLNTLFKRAESEILVPRMGLSFKNFGFRI